MQYVWVLRILSTNTVYLTTNPLRLQQFHNDLTQLLSYLLSFKPPAATLLRSLYLLIDFIAFFPPYKRKTFLYGAFISSSDRRGKGQGISIVLATSIAAHRSFSTKHAEPTSFSVFLIYNRVPTLKSTQNVSSPSHSLLRSYCLTCWNITDWRDQDQLLNVLYCALCHISQLNTNIRLWQYSFNSTSIIPARPQQEQYELTKANTPNLCL